MLSMKVCQHAQQAFTSTLEQNKYSSWQHCLYWPQMRCRSCLSTGRPPWPFETCRYDPGLRADPYSTGGVTYHSVKPQCLKLYQKPIAMQLNFTLNFHHLWQHSLPHMQVFAHTSCTYVTKLQSWISPSNSVLTATKKENHLYRLQSFINIKTG